MNHPYEPDWVAIAVDPPKVAIRLTLPLGVEARVDDHGCLFLTWKESQAFSLSTELERAAEAVILGPNPQYPRRPMGPRP